MGQESLSSLLREPDLPADVGGFGHVALPFAVGSGRVFEAIRAGLVLSSVWVNVRAVVAWLAWVTPRSRGSDGLDSPMRAYAAGDAAVVPRSAAAWETEGGVLLLALMASGSTEQAEVAIAQLLTGLGWALKSGQPSDRRAVTRLVAEDVHLLRRVGALDSDRKAGWPGQVTVGGSHWVGPHWVLITHDGSPIPQNELE